jgi:hypothetical protein
MATTKKAAATKAEDGPKVIKVRIEFTEEMLGTKAANVDVFADYIASKCPDDDARREELETAEHIEEAGTSVFHRDEAGAPMLWDYQVKGFFKDACGSLRRPEGTKSNALKAYKSIIDGCVFVFPRKITLVIPEGGEVGVCERPLRASGPTGERVALCRSETVPAGTYMDIEIRLLMPSLMGVVKEWLDYGNLRGMGQWRNSGKGRFEWIELEQGQGAATR